MMESPDNSFSDLVELVKSCIPRRSEPVSRDFWMPDHSCRVCYECDLQFTIFNRRHHCRLCGRIFCGKCTANSVPISSIDPIIIREEGERIRVCNFCFMQWEQETETADNGTKNSNSRLSPSLSVTSVASTKSSGTINSSTMTVGSRSFSAGAYQHPLCDSRSSPRPPDHLEKQLEKEDMMVSGRDADSVTDVGDPSPNIFRFCMNRSDDDEEDYAGFRSDSETNYQCVDGRYYSQVEYDEGDQGHQSNTVQPAEDTDDGHLCSTVNENDGSHVPLDVDKMEEEAIDNNYDCDASSSIYGIESVDSEPVDFENNGLLWLPPDPEDEQDEMEAGLFDDEDDEDARRMWGYLRPSNSFGSGQYRSRDRTSEEHKKAMKNVVDGHFRALIAQLLEVENLPVDEEVDKESWLEIITSLSWEAATLLKPDTSKGGGMDPGGYVKIKCLASGHPSESMVVKGVVCRKNIAHRRMPSRIENPSFLILGGALEYQRVANLSRFDTLLQQEMDHLKMAVAKIDAYHPDVLLVEKSVSRFAQDCLLAKNISLVLNVKRPLLERIARCTDAQIVPSIDHLSSQKLGHSDMFRVEKFNEEHGSAGQGGKKLMKNLMFFEGCPKPLGCTVLLVGSNGDELKKVKHVLQYGVFAAYHLALETSFLADEGASLPDLPLKSPITVGLPDKPSIIERSISTIPTLTIPAAGEPQVNCDGQSLNTSHPIITSVDSGKTEITTAAATTYLSESCKPQVEESTIINLSFDSNNVHVERNDSPHRSIKVNKVCFGECHEAETFRKCSEALAHDPIVSVDSPEDTGDVIANGTQVHGSQMYAGPTSHHQDDQNHEHNLSREEFTPSDHQSILVSLSTRCVWKGTVCERAHLFRIKYYGNFDKPLGRFLRDHLFDQGYKCRSCDMPSEAHVHCYTHRQGSLTISVRKLPELHLPGELDGKIWMWHRCLLCPRNNGLPPSTLRVVMSDAAWGLSFGKFLELSFSNNAAASRVASCGHSLHRDCLRFYGVGKMVACFRYAPISVNSVYLPPSKLDFNYQHQEWVQMEGNEVALMSGLLFTEVLHALHQIGGGGRTLNSGSCNGDMYGPTSKHGIFELESILQKEKLEFEESLKKVLKKEAKKGQPVIDILEINKLRRQLLFLSYLWDHRLIFAAESTATSLHDVFSGFSTSDKEKPCSVDKLGEINLAPNPEKSFTSSDTFPCDSLSDEFSVKGNIKNGFHQQDGMHGDLNKSIVGHELKRDLELDLFQPKHSRTYLCTSTSATDPLVPKETGLDGRRALSDGHFPIMTNLSETFDSKWTGENNPSLADASMSDSSASIEATAAVSFLEDSEERSGAEVTQSFASTLLSKLGDSAEDISSLIGMPFLNIYRSLNKNRSGAQRFNSLSKYNPVYVYLFQELEHQGGARLLLPVCMNDTVIPIFDDEPTSIIAYALASPSYHSQMLEEREKVKDSSDPLPPFSSHDSGNFHLSQFGDENPSEYFKSFGSMEDSILSLPGSRTTSLVSDALNSTKAMHVRVYFADEGSHGKVKYTVTCYYAKYFDALRRICCPYKLDFIRSLSRCKKWGAQGGKSNVFFAKSLDDRFIVKQVTKTEIEAFMKFAPEYFKYLSQSIDSGSPTCLAKILGIYQVVSKHLKRGKESRMDVLVMENLLFGRNITRLYDLKGSSRSRYNPDSSGNNKVLLDQNLIEAMPTSPIFVGNKAKRLLERSVWNDTAFLAVETGNNSKRRCPVSSVRKRSCGSENSRKVRGARNSM